jgi:inner membrane protein
MPVMAAAAVGLVRIAARRPVKWLWAWAAATIAVASHLALDLTNSYGIRLLLPFSGRWLHLDLTSLIDLWIWGVMLLAVAAPFLGRLVGAEIASGGGKARHHGRGWAIFALAFLLVYNYGRSVLHDRALAVLGSRIYHGRPPLRVEAGPSSANPWQWHGMVETDSFYAFADVNLLGDFDPAQATVLHKPEPDPAIDAASRTEAFREFLEFAQYPLFRVSPVPEPEGARKVELFDVRRGPWTSATALVTANGQVVETHVTYRRWRL